MGVMSVSGGARAVLRRNPRLHRLVGRAVERFTGPYEARFLAAMQESLEPGTCIWDVGANVGEYTRTFGAAVGAEGHVVAVEPSPSCCVVLTQIAAAFPNVTVVQAALGDREGVLALNVSAGPDAVSNHVRAQRTGSTIDVRSVRADTLVREGLPPPEAVKIDVEGFESEVLRGMKDLLAGSRLRSVFLEVHFAQLADRGMRGEPRRITSELRHAGFTVSWIDPSHLVGRR